MNTFRLQQKVKKSGIKKGFIANELGLSYPGFYTKMRGDREFTAIEAFKIKAILHLNEDEFDYIFNYDEIKSKYEMDIDEDYDDVEVDPDEYSKYGE